MNKIILGDCLEKLKEMSDNSVDSIVTDPPYELGFMGKSWDNTGIANNKEMWAECLRVLKPGGHLLAFSGTRTYHRMACAIEDAGFEVRDMITWAYGQGFPKSLNVFKQLQKKCYCGNMGVYENRTKQVGTNSEKESEYFMRFVQEANLSQTKSIGEKRGKVLQSGLSEQSSYSTMLREESKEGSDGRKERILEGGNNNQKTEGQLQGSDLPKMSERVSTNGEEGRLHNATQVSNGSTLEQIAIKSGSSASYRPQSEQQQYKQPCAFCKQWGTQATRTLGIGSALKPSIEPICFARKPLEKGLTIAENVLKYGTGGINIDESRVDFGNETDKRVGTDFVSNGGDASNNKNDNQVPNKHYVQMYKEGGRFPANLIHDGSDEVRECFPETKSNGEYKKTGDWKNTGDGEIRTWDIGYDKLNKYAGQEGNASRFFKSIIYQAKASKSERDKGCESFPIRRPDTRTSTGMGTFEEKGVLPGRNFHPTVKPIALMEYLIKMVTPKGGVVLDPFAGSGSTLVAAKQNGFQYIGIEITEEYIPIIEARLKNSESKQTTLL